MKKIIPLAIALSLLTGCASSDFKKSKGLSAPEGEFEKSLFANYMALAQEEYDETDYHDADYFALRAAALSRGEEVAPQEINERKLPQDAVIDLNTARHKLIHALNSEFTVSDPKNRALAQAQFDCWLQEQEENFQPEDIARCKDNFYAAMEPLQELMKIKPQSIIVLFDLDSSKISDEGATALAHIRAEALRDKRYKVDVYGHADKAGKEDHNDALSAARVNAITKFLIKEGVERDRINTEFYGEDRPEIKTDDGVREMQNRRVFVELHG